MATIHGCYELGHTLLLLGAWARARQGLIAGSDQAHENMINTLFAGGYQKANEETGWTGPGSVQTVLLDFCHTHSSEFLRNHYLVGGTNIFTVSLGDRSDKIIEFSN